MTAEEKYDELLKEELADSIPGDPAPEPKYTDEELKERCAAAHSFYMASVLVLSASLNSVRTCSEEVKAAYESVSSLVPPALLAGLEKEIRVAERLCDEVIAFLGNEETDSGFMDAIRAAFAAIDDNPAIAIGALQGVKQETESINNLLMGYITKRMIGGMLGLNGMPEEEDDD